jgi:NADH-quinone oxidoreductase subunit A
MSLLFTGFLVVIGLVLILLFVTYSANASTYDYDKHASYECGFEPFGDARGYFDVYFYVTGLLLVVFDLEIAFLIPFVIDVANVSFSSMCGFLVIVYILVLGFFYEWRLGLLTWVPFYSRQK